MRSSWRPERVGGAKQVRVIHREHQPVVTIELAKFLAKIIVVRRESPDTPIGFGTWCRSSQPRRWESAPLRGWWSGRGRSWLFLLVAFELRPLDARAPMVVEAQWERPNVAMRQRVTSCLRSEYRGETIMASMGSLAHYVQELSLAGFNLRDFLHEGNGDS